MMREMTTVMHATLRRESCVASVADGGGQAINAIKHKLNVGGGKVELKDWVPIDDQDRSAEET